jgi:hypothetical protein
MTRAQQQVAILSNLHAIDFMCALLLVKDPSIYFLDKKTIEHDTIVPWNVAGSARHIEFATIDRAALNSGIVAIRALMEFLGVRASKPKVGEEPTLRIKNGGFSDPGEDFHWSFIQNARPLTPEILDSPELAEFETLYSDQEKWNLRKVLTHVLRAASMYVTHLVHPIDAGGTTNGQVVVAGTLTCIAVQELVLLPAWDNRFDEVVYRNSTLILPAPLASERTIYLEELRTEFAKAIQRIMKNQNMK